MKDTYYLIGLADYFGDGEKQIREKADSLEELDTIRDIMSHYGTLAEALDNFKSACGDGQENQIIIKAGMGGVTVIA